MQASHSLTNAINENHLQLDPSNFTSLHHKKKIPYTLYSKHNIISIPKANVFTKKKREMPLFHFSAPFPFFDISTFIYSRGSQPFPFTVPLNQKLLNRRPPMYM